MSKIRTDIQALRGIAVLMVLLYHSKIGGIEAGYLGVDIFFVISGYLITSLIVDGIERGNFRLSDFYFRRAKRLFPAAYVTILACAGLGPLFLNQQELKDFALQAIGAITFTANFVLWQQTGYFEGASDLKPLLHTWSLSIEEQYYLLLPAGLLILPRSLWFKAILSGFAISLAFCVFGMFVKPVATFYLLPTRAWELLIGSAGALLIANSGARSRIAHHPVVSRAFYPSLLGIALLGIFPTGGQHPGIGAFLVCFATLFVILRQHESLEHNPASKCLAMIGNISYSLYLVHWPIIAMAKNAWVGNSSDLPIAIRLTALGLSFATAYLMYRFIEDPIRKANFSLTPRLAVITVTASLFLMAITPQAIHIARSSNDFGSIRRINYGLDKECEYKSLYTPKPECVSGSNVSILVWGDSYAMHLVPGLLEGRSIGAVAQATRSACGPLLTLGPQRKENPSPGPIYDREWAEDCIAFNQSVIDFVRKRSEIETVIISSALEQYISSEFLTIVNNNGSIEAVAPTIQRAVDSLLLTIAEIRAAGKRAILIAPPPSAGFNIGACLERRSSGLVAFGATDGCAIPRQMYEERMRSVLLLLAAAERAGIPVIRPSEFLCSENICRTSIDGTMIYRDGGHLSHDGSRLIATKMNWPRLIAEQAK